MKTPAIFRTIILVGATALAACTGVNPAQKPGDSHTLATKAERKISTSPSHGDGEVLANARSSRV